MLWFWFTMFDTCEQPCGTVAVEDSYRSADMSLFVDMLKIRVHGRHIHYHSSVPSVPTSISVRNCPLKHFAGFDEADGNVLCCPPPFWNTVRHLHMFLIQGNNFVWMVLPVPPSPPILHSSASSDGRLSSEHYCFYFKRKRRKKESQVEIFVIIDLIATRIWTNNKRVPVVLFVEFESFIFMLKNHCSLVILSQREVCMRLIWLFTENMTLRGKYQYAV